MAPSGYEKPLEFAVEQINNLRAFRKSSIITDEDYTFRRDQIIDVFSGETLRASLCSTEVSPSRKYSKSVGCSPILDEPLHNPSFSKDLKHFSFNSAQDSLELQIKKHPPPDWDDEKYPIENATRVTYNFDTKTWDRKNVKVKLDTEPFEKGGFRLVFHLRDISDPETAFVAKLSIDNQDTDIRTTYFDDVRMQSVAAYFARKYNSYNPPKLIMFISAYVLELKQREGKPVCGVEKFIKGHYKKYNNNNGWISDDHRNTPAAFCHFSYVASNKELLLCDIQGVGDVYTDPQIHSKDGKGYGRGNLGQEGIVNFLATHQCNCICQFLGLPNVTGRPLVSDGTLPHKINRRPNRQQNTDYEHICSPIRLYKNPKLHKEEERDSVCTCCML